MCKSLQLWLWTHNPLATLTALAVRVFRLHSQRLQPIILWLLCGLLFTIRKYLPVIWCLLLKIIFWWTLILPYQLPLSEHLHTSPHTFIFNPWPPFRRQHAAKEHNLSDCLASQATRAHRGCERVLFRVSYLLFCPLPLFISFLVFHWMEWINLKIFLFFLYWWELYLLFLCYFSGYPYVMV